MSHDHHGHGHSHSHGHEHGHAHEHEGQGADEPCGHEHEELASGARSERYELEDLFGGEAPENQHFLKILGVVLVVALLALALAYPLVVG
ncbi:MAG: hypothetical protein HY721_19825 [Planctomycetes bacterium]|nr:hypothetical protein [Planctomycetota bacterium]